MSLQGAAGEPLLPAPRGNGALASSTETASLARLDGARALVVRPRVAAEVVRVARGDLPARPGRLDLLEVAHHVEGGLAHQAALPGAIRVLVVLIAVHAQLRHGIPRHE